MPNLDDYRLIHTPLSLAISQICKQLRNQRDENGAMLCVSAEAGPIIPENFPTEADCPQWRIWPTTITAKNEGAGRGYITYWSVTLTAWVYLFYAGDALQLAYKREAYIKRMLSSLMHAQYGGGANGLIAFDFWNFDMGPSGGESAINVNHVQSMRLTDGRMQAIEPPFYGTSITMQIECKSDITKNRYDNALANLQQI